ncbi:hypothetical protein WM40_11430 [Robbsia andropogonis]|uniref:Uncharacterized protein n=1 Tax=Robbsia andropogonis TaxID=28092 RepID=A0A0F5K0H9_9BURK|nr:hypothetical protein WM40_11430 [Robbsia andropogonis]
MARTWAASYRAIVSRVLSKEGRPDIVILQNQRANTPWIDMVPAVAPPRLQTLPGCAGKAAHGYQVAHYGTVNLHPVRRPLICLLPSPARADRSAHDA